MSALPQSIPSMSVEEYLAFERASEIKHEYFDGEIYAMTGASEAHNLINLNVATALKNQLRGRPCKIYASDMRVKMARSRIYTYPDISIVCGEARFADGEFDTLINPTLIIEVLSPSTERHDRGAKFRAYRELDSLQEYLLIEQDAPRIERYLRQESGLWLFSEAKDLSETMELPSIGCTLALVDVYEQVNFTTTEE